MFGFSGDQPVKLGIWADELSVHEYPRCAPGFSDPSGSSSANDPAPGFFPMKPFGQLTYHRFHAAAGGHQSPNAVWGPGIGPVGPPRGLQITSGGGEFWLQEGTDVALIPNDQALNPLGQIPKRLGFITGGWASADEEPV